MNQNTKSNAASTHSRVSENAQSIAIDLSRDAEVRNLYLTHPYFLDVLRWMGGELEYWKINHFYTDAQFRSRVLPELKGELIKLGLLSVVSGNVVPTFNRVELSNVPTGSATQVVLADHAFHCVVRRANEALTDLKSVHIRTRVPHERFDAWMTKLQVLLSEVEGMSAENGESVSLCFFVTKGG